MSIKLTCPICERSQIEYKICPNCETDLSTYGLLASLPRCQPRKVETKKRIIPIWLPVGIAVLFLLLGLSLGYASNSLIAQPPSTIQFSTTAVDPTLAASDRALPIAKVAKPKLDCGGFNYIVRRGDSLSAIAHRFYGNSNSWLLISAANPSLQGSENFIDLNDSLLIPNLKTSCLNS